MCKELEQIIHKRRYIKSQKAHEKLSPSLVTRETQNHGDTVSLPVEWLKLKPDKCEDEEQLGLSNTDGGNVKTNSHFTELFRHFLKS